MNDKKPEEQNDLGSHRVRASFSLDLPCCECTEPRSFYWFGLSFEEA